jgi:hypothetical protein
MNYFKLIWLSLFDLLKQLVSLPRLVVNAIKQRKVQASAKLLEDERLDRIRNPTKYLGK